MDLKDRKILEELVLNSRTPINRLAKKVGLSREVVTYRIKQLKIKGIITGFHATIEEEKLGYLRDTCFIQLKGISPSKEKQFIDYLKNHEFITYVGTIIGKWNVVFDILSRNRKEMDRIIKEIQDKIRKNFSIFALAGNIISGGYYPEKVFGSKKFSSFDKNKKIKIDKTDLKILRLLSENSRIEYSELSKKLNLTANAIKYRIKNLEESGIIDRYTISTDIKKLGYSWYNIQVKLIAGEKEIKEFLEKDKTTIYHYHYIGNENWDIDIGIIVKNSEELRTFLIKFRERFPEFFKIHDVYIVLDVLKENILPKGVFKTT
ncbi:Lrp/AsnC family transcriptional regulator [Nanoarchaeota archaeon]